MVLDSFVSGNLDTVKDFIKPSVLKSFKVAIDERIKENELLLIDLKSIEKNKIVKSTVTKSSIATLKLLSTEGFIKSLTVSKFPLTKLSKTIFKKVLDHSENLTRQIFGSTSRILLISIFSKLLFLFQ